MFLLSGYQVIQVVCLVHSDLHDDQTLNAVNFLASSILWLTQDTQQTGAGKTTTRYSPLKMREESNISLCALLFLYSFGNIGEDFQERAPF